jgi:diguanylate cyclase (GGDEF)-like protein
MNSENCLGVRDGLLDECLSPQTPRIELETGCLACGNCVNLVLKNSAEELEVAKEQISTLSTATQEKDLQIADLKMLSQTDHLTRLPNRHALEPLFEDYREKAELSGQKFLLIMLDLDAFKDVNDKQGYDKGDDILEGVADGLQEKLRREGDTLRHGGDEFIVMAWIPEYTDTKRGGHSDIEFAVQTGKYIQKSVVELDFIASFNASPITKNLGFKYGYSIFSPGKTLEEMKAEADPKPPGGKPDSGELRIIDEHLERCYQQLEARLSKRRASVKKSQF